MNEKTRYYDISQQALAAENEGMVGATQRYIRSEKSSFDELALIRAEGEGMVARQPRKQVEIRERESCFYLIQRTL